MKILMDYTPGTGPLKNPWGFVKHDYSIENLRDLMEEEGIRETDIIIITSDLHNLQKEYLDMRYCPTAPSQSSALQLIENMLTGRYPHVFQEDEKGVKLLYLAVHVIMALHSTLRRKKSHDGQSQKHSKVTWQEGDDSRNTDRTSERIRPPTRVSPRLHRHDRDDTVDIIDLVQDDDLEALNMGCCIRRTVDIPQEFPGVGLDNDPSSSSSANNSVIVCRPAPTISLRRPAPAISLQKANVFNPPCASGSNSSHLRNGLIFSSEEEVGNIQQSDIYSFLSSCEPPMVHYLRCFVDFGCTTSTYLRSIARWIPEQRYALLKRILRTGFQDGAPPEIDIAVLENQFATAFLDN
ncbi:hypothetical protein BDN70DRAFT_993059 [Pholiota conissans]|uniref:Uncharacterized protein n=1 Tax=Pholiota conissans TaxID=109636 RepID=A0A9P5Z379_9AGAR|nr:hypothetical protein BDN70DRAFT_993059 [Pholiota conissans]